MTPFRLLPPRCYINLFKWLTRSLVPSKAVTSSRLNFVMASFGVSSSMQSKREEAVSSCPTKPIGQIGVSSGDLKPLQSEVLAAVSSSPIKPTTKTAPSSGVNNRVSGKAPVSSGGRGNPIVPENAGKVISFKDVTFGPHEAEVRFRLIHFWEAWNTQTKVLIGLEMLLIDEEENVMQGFIPQGRIDTYLPHIKAGATYRLNKFFGSKSKTYYRVAEPDVTLTFTWNSVLSVLDDGLVRIPEDRFRIHGYKEFEVACGLKGELYDYVGHIKLVNGQVLNGSLQLDEAEIASSRRVELHVQTHDDPVLKLYLWDKAAVEFCVKFKASRNSARVILVTTLNPKRFGGVLCLSSMSSSRVFMDSDVEDTRYYLSWLSSNLEVANRVNAEIVTKPESVTLGEIFSYMKNPATKVVLFECTTTIDDVVHGQGWYYIGCGLCHTKATKGPTTLMCKKCGKSEIVGVPQYRAKLSVYDKKDQAVFVLLGDAGEELTGKKASELVESYYQANDSEGEEHIVPVPQALIATIGQTRKFIVKVTDKNFTAQVPSLTVIKVLPNEPLHLEHNEGENIDEVAPLHLEHNEGENIDEVAVNKGVGHADESVKRCGDGSESEDAKRAKCG